MKRLCIAAAVCSLVVGVFAAAGSASTGISLSQASSRLEFNVRLVVPQLVTTAKETLREYKALGAAGAIANAQRNLQAALNGFTVDNAACMGVQSAPGGYKAFRCKLAISLDGYTRYAGKAQGSYTRTAGGSWVWRTSSLTWWENLLGG